jgi:DNA polymerase elongation subunit (family B)
MNLNPRVLVLDIETAPMLAYVWGTRDQNIALNQLQHDWYVIAWAAKWLGQPPSKTIYQDQRSAKNIENDRKILSELWYLLDQADIIITQNGQNFDSPKLNARFITHGMKPPSPYKHLDTYQIASRVGKFTSNKLEYLTDKLCTKYKKLTHKKFPGFSLWTECLKGNKAAWDEMKRYNIHDVLATEELYGKLRAWAPASMPNAFFAPYVSLKCGTCGTFGEMERRGSSLTKKARYQRYQCQQCGSWSQGAKEQAA